MFKSLAFLVTAFPALLIAQVPNAFPNAVPMVPVTTPATANNPTAQAVSEKFDIRGVERNIQNNGSPDQFFQIIIKTGNRIGSGTDARVFIQFGDGHGHHVNAFLNRRGWNDFMWRSVNTFTVKSQVAVMDVCQMTLGHDNTWAGADWWVDYVTINNGIRTWTFPVNGWITRRNPSGRAFININRCPPLGPIGTVNTVPMPQPLGVPAAGFV